MNGRGRRQAAADVVAEAHRRGADLGREQLGGERAEAREVAGPEERDERPEHEQRGGLVGDPVERHQRRPRQQVGDVAAAPAEGVGGEAEEDVAEPLADAHHDQPGRGLHQVEAAPALRRPAAKVGGDPGEEPPVAEHRAGVHGGGEQAVAAEVLAPQHAQRARAAASRAGAQPDLRLRHVAPDPEARRARAARRRRTPRASRSAAARPRPRRRRPSRRSPSVDCIRPSALPRCSGGHVSAISAAPVVHSPPMPSPSMKRKIASWTIVVERPQAPLASE